MMTWQLELPRYLITTEVAIAITNMITSAATS